MISNISWEGYWIFIALLSISYYLFVYLFYFKKDFLVNPTKVASTNEGGPFAFNSAPSETGQILVSKEPTPFDHPDDFQRPVKGTIEDVVYTCIDEVSAYLAEAKRAKCEKGEILNALRSILRKYPAISSSEYKESLVKVIVGQCEYHCSVHLNGSDVVCLWV